MDFFAHQDLSRRQTRRLVILFVLAVLAIVVVVNLILAALFPGLLLALSSGSPPTGRHPSGQPGSAVGWLVENQPGAFLPTSLAIVCLIGAVSLFKIWRLARGGGVGVAKQLGAIRADPQAGMREQVLCNVVEEMAIASGTVVPQIYILYGERTINAFAAGLRVDDAVVAVTEGALEALNRDELQGVIAHEFSHILNGDMRLNLRVVGILHGILAFSIVGEHLFSLRGRRSDGSANIRIFGLALFAVGYIGYFFGALIRASLSRQREFLADASAVQFTRNPGGIAGALRKIAAWPTHSLIRAPGAGAISHMFFADALKKGWFNLMATHPPLQERIKRLGGRLAPFEEAAASPSVPLGMPGTVTAAGLASATSLRQTVTASWGGQLPQGPVLRGALLQALLPEVKFRSEAQSRSLREIVGEEVFASLNGVSSGQATYEQKIAFVDVALAEMARLRVTERDAFLAAARRLIKADGQISLEEYALYKLMQRYLRPVDLKRDASGMNALQASITVLAAIAEQCALDADTQKRLFVRYTQRLLRISKTIEKPIFCLDTFDKALARLNGTPPMRKMEFYAACVEMIQADGKVNINEAQLLRGICAAIDIPVPLIHVNV